MRVLGADVAAGAWVGVVLDGAAAPEVLTAPDVTALVALAVRGGPLAVVGLDIPIGLPDTGRRRADDLVRALIGPRRSSVFQTPVRAALTTPDHAEAVRRNRAAAGEGVSRQAHGLRHKVLEVDAWLRPPGGGATGPTGAGGSGRLSAPGAVGATGAPGGPVVVEVHPEASFAAMAGAPLAHRKKSWAGAHQRWSLLAAAGVSLRGDLGEAGALAAVDDVLDAAACAWTARRVAAGTARPHPDPPEPMPDAWAAAVWV